MMSQILASISRVFAQQMKQPIPSFSANILYYIGLLSPHNRYMTYLAIDLCEMKKGQNVLEIGYGSGIGFGKVVKNIAPDLFYRIFTPKIKSADSGLLYGCEISKYAEALTAKKYRRLIRLGVIQLLYCSPDHLDLPSDHLDACYHVNSFYYWRSLDDTLQCLHDKIKQGGKIVTVFSPKRLKREIRYGLHRYSEPDPLAYAIALERNGFSHAKFVNIGTFVAIIASKPYVKLVSCPSNKEDFSQ